jgi:hypothetical protein
MTPRRAALVKRVTELHQADLWAGHYAKEFTLQWIRSLGRQEKLAYECSRLDDSISELAEGKVSNYLVADV